MPSVTEYYKRNGSLPKRLTFSFAAYIAFYHTAKERGEGCLKGVRGDSTYDIKDDAWVLDFFYDHREDTAEEIVHAVVNNERMWGTDLAELPGFEAAVLSDLKNIESLGAADAIREVC